TPSPGYNDPALQTPGTIVPRGDGTYDYDGGPRVPIPMPGADPSTRELRGGVSASDRAVSLPAKGKWVYPAYGEKAHRELPDDDPPRVAPLPAMRVALPR